MKIKNVLAGAIGLAVSCGWAATPAALMIPAVLPPKLDGMLDDACWQNAAKVDRLNLLSADVARTSDETVFYICRDNAWLYLGVHCVNPDMQHVEQTVFEHDGAIMNDESVEVFIDPGSGGKQALQFMLSFAGVKGEKSFGPMGANTQPGWNCPWRAVTRRLPAGWEAEIAIPLFALQGGTLSETRINLLRNRSVPEVDTLGAKQGERKEYYALVAKHSVKDASQYVKLDGLDDKSVETPFAPVIDGVELGVFEQGAEGYFYPITLTLSPATAVGGKAEIWVVETQDGKMTEHKCQTVALKQPEKIIVKAPLANFNERAILVALRDHAGSLLASANIADTSGLAIVKDAFVGRSYYTTEQNAELKVVLGVSDKMLEKIDLRVTVAGKVLFEKSNPKSELIAGLPLKDIKTGRHQARLSVMENGRELYGADYDIIKLEPKPGCEVKADFIRKTLLKDGEPYFMLAMVGHRIREERHFKKMAELGFNAIHIMKVGEFPELADLAEKYGLQVVDWGLAKSDIKAWEGLQAARKNYEAMLPKYRQAAQNMADRKNYLMRFQVDEPNLDAADVNLKVMEWFYNDLRETDPYRPFLLNFSKYLPPGKAWTAYAEALSDDIYPRPWTQAGLLSEPGLGQAYYADKLRRRCEKDHKLMFMVPLAGQHSIQKGPLGMTRQQMLCQNYVNLIYGVKGLDFFCITTPANYDSWAGLQMLCGQIKHLSPALLNYEVKQDVTYPGQVYDAAGARFPQVIGRMFQWPDGDYILLAANLRHFAADVTFKLPAADEVAVEFDDQRRLRVKDGTFADRLEPFGTRAYRIKGALKAPLQLEIVAIADEKEQALSVDVPAIIRQLHLGKNYCPNPCFERQLIPGSPDFYKPFILTDAELTYEEAKKGSVWYVDDEVRWEGHPSLRMDRSRELLLSRGLFGACYPLPSDTPAQMVFSFYAKAARDGASLVVNLQDLAKVRQEFKLTADWQRIVVPITVNPKKIGDKISNVRMFVIMPGSGAVVWVSGLQLEAGTAATEFQDASVLREARIEEDPANLVKNGHAEYGDMRYWQRPAKGNFLTRDAFSGKFAFQTDNSSIHFESNLFPVDPSRAYDLSGQFKAVGGNPRVVFGLMLYDLEKRPIRACNVRMVKGTETELLAACTAGDKVLQVKDAARWKSGCRAAFEPEQGLPVFNVSAAVESIFQSDDAWSVRLSAPCGLAYPAGTKIMASADGTNGIFPCGMDAVPNEWTAAQGQITPAMFQAWPGTAYASVAVIPKLPPGKKITISMDDICMKLL